MQLDSTFSVVAPIDMVWDALMDFERVAGCVPGVQIQNKLSDDAYQGTMKVKLGPVTMEYKGQMTVVERDAVVHRAVFQGRAKERRGQGTADGTATLQLTEADGTTRGTVSVELSLSGKAAAMGKGVINSVTERMMALFAENLQAIVGEPVPAPVSAPANVSDADSVSSASIPPVSRPANITTDNSLNAFALAKGVIADQFKSPAVVVSLLAVMAVGAFFLGRFSSKFVRLERRGSWRLDRHA